MTGKQLKEALLNQTPVIAHIKGIGDIWYPKIYEISYRRSEYLDKGRILLSVGLLDKNKNSVTFVRSSNIRYADEDEQAQKNTADADTSTVN